MNEDEKKALNRLFGVLERIATALELQVKGQREALEIHERMLDVSQESMVVTKRLAGDSESIQAELRTQLRQGAVY